MFGACRACEAKDNEIAHLRKLVAYLQSQHHEAIQQLTRIARVEAGLPEVAPGPKPPPEPMPNSVQLLISRYGSQETKAQQMRDALAANKRGVPWADIEAQLRKDFEDDNPPA